MREQGGLKSLPLRQILAIPTIELLLNRGGLHDRSAVRSAFWCPVGVRLNLVRFRDVVLQLGHRAQDLMNTRRSRQVPPDCE